MRRVSASFLVFLALFASEVQAQEESPAACTKPLDIRAYPNGKLFWDKIYAPEALPKAIERSLFREQFDCLEILDASKGKADRQAITDLLKSRVAPRGFDTLAIVWKEVEPWTPPPEPPLPDDPMQYSPLTRDEYVALEKELVPLSSCVHDSQIGSARFTGTIDGKRIAKKIVAVGEAENLLRDAGRLPEYLKPEAAVASPSKGELIDQTSAAFWGLPMYAALSNAAAARTLTERLRARAIFAYYGGVATKECRPSETFTRLFEKANKQ